MKELFEFLNMQSGERLFWYGVVFIFTVYLVMQGLVYIFQSIFKCKNK